jgi:hypothetical protein
MRGEGLVAAPLMGPSIAAPTDSRRQARVTAEGRQGLRPGHGQAKSAVNIRLMPMQDLLGRNVIVGAS